MRKVTVLGYRPVLDEVVHALQDAGVLQIDATTYDLETEDLAPDDDRLRELEKQLAEAHFVRDFLGGYHKNKQPFSTFVSEKFHVSLEDYEKLTWGVGPERLYRTCTGIANKLTENQREAGELRQLVRDLRPWQEFRLPISEWRGTDQTVLFTGTVSSFEGAAVRAHLRAAVDEVTVEELGPVGERQAWVVIAHRERLSEVRSVLAATSFTEVSFPGLSDYPAEEIAIAQDRIAVLEAERTELTGRAQELSDEHYSAAVTRAEVVETMRDRLAVRRDIGRTERAFAISGWVPERLEADLAASLSRFDHDVDVTLAEPGDEDHPPVELENPKWLKPLEVLTDLYGRPFYGDIDPTPLLAPFFLAYFGICIGDVGYGLMLIVGSQLIKHRVDVAPGVKRFLDLLTYGGVAAIGFGVAFASYFAIPVDSLPPALAGLQLLDPLNELTTFLLFTLVLGATQVFFGVLVAAYAAFRRNDPASAVFEQLSTLFLFAMIAAFVLTGQGALLSVGLVGTMLMQGRAIDSVLMDRTNPIWDRGLGAAWLAVVLAGSVMTGMGMVMPGLLVISGVSLVLAFVSKVARKGVLGMLGGAYSVYGMSGFVGDILSFTRLAALGLSGSLVGFVFNILAGLVWGPASALFSRGGVFIVLGALVALFAVAIFVVGHVFNVVINLLGAFVHPARLQFVEFFSKFYEAGGRSFTPFKVRSENLVLEAGAAGSEGGAG